VTQRTRFTVYLVSVHALLAGTGVALLLQYPVWLVVVEAVFVVSAGVGIALTKRMFSTITQASAGTQLIRDGEFTSRLLPVGQPEVDELIGVYNRMIDHLRDQRTQLQEQQHFLADVLRVSPAGILVLDFDRRIVSINPAGERLLGRTLDQLTAVSLDDVEAPLARSIAALAAGETTVVTTSSSRRIRCHHGTFVDRGFRRSFVLFEELTEELRQAERSAYEKLIRVMAHEVNNSVTASNSLLTSSLTYGSELSADSREDFDRAIGIVIQRTAQLNQFMRSFADVFRLPAPFKQPERVVEVLEDTVRLVGARPDASTVRWTWDVDDAGLTVPMDRGQMEQAFLNILQNAIEAQAEAVTVRLHARNGVRPTLHIEDSGQGFGPEAEANLFTPFFSTKPNGQGIGLTLVREILSAHGFDYSLHGQPGEPTTFTIIF
jgi:nitrogen fixation/metabolism regulation signal transduction histidine kinase